MGWGGIITAYNLEYAKIALCFKFGGNGLRRSLTSFVLVRPAVNVNAQQTCIVWFGKVVFWSWIRILSEMMTQKY